MTVLIIGYGNALAGDDGAGPAAIARFVDDPRFAGHDLRVRRQLTPELAVDVAAADLVVLVDAAVGGTQPGTVRLSRVTPAPNGSASSHHLAPEALLGLAETLYAATPPAYLVTVTAADVGLGAQLSEPVQRALPGITAAVADLVRRAATRP